MKVVLLTDTHFGARGDSQIFLDYFEKFYSKSFFPYLKQHKIDTVIHLGDVFDERKKINYVSLNRAKKMFFGPTLQMGIDLQMLVGNHDAFYNNTNKINALNQNLRAFENIITWHKAGTHTLPDGTEICMVPWINAENYAETMDVIKNTKAQICLGHLEIAGFRMYKDGIAGGNLDPNIFQKFDMTCSGHYHHKSSRGDIHYLGNTYEITWADYNDARGFHILDTETRELEFIRNPFEIFHKVWYDDEDKELNEILDLDFSQFEGTYVKVIVTTKTNPYHFDRFLDKLYKSNAQDIKIVDDHHNMGELSEDEIMNGVDDTLTVLKKTVKAMNIRRGKKDLDKLLQALYTESLNSEIV